MIFSAESQKILDKRYQNHAHVELTIGFLGFSIFKDL